VHLGSLTNHSTLTVTRLTCTEILTGKHHAGQPGAPVQMWTGSKPKALSSNCLTDREIFKKIKSWTPMDSIPIMEGSEGDFM